MKKKIIVISTLKNIGKEFEINSHSDMIKFVQLELSALRMVSYPIQSGTFKSMDGRRIVRIGIDGHSDILVICWKETLFIEIKIKKDKQRDTQASFQKMVESRGHCYYIISDKNYKEVLLEISKRHTGINKGNEEETELLHRPLPCPQ